jgi:hypothetical protein
VDEIFIQEMCFFICLAINVKKYKILRKNPPSYQIGGDFINGHFLVFICLVMFYESQR